MSISLVFLTSPQLLNNYTLNTKTLPINSILCHQPHILITALSLNQFFIFHRSPNPPLFPSIEPQYRTRREISKRTEKARKVSRKKKICMLLSSEKYEVNELSYHIQTTWHMSYDMISTFPTTVLLTCCDININ